MTPSVRSKASRGVALALTAAAFLAAGPAAADQFRCNPNSPNRPWPLTPAENSALGIRAEGQWLIVQIDGSWTNHVEEAGVVDDKRKMGRYDRQLHPSQAREVELYLSYSIPGLSTLQVVTNGTDYRGQYICYPG